VEVEVRDLRQDLATAAAKLALEEIHKMALAADPDATQPNSLGAVNRSAGGEAVAVDERVSELLVRGLQFCIWSKGAYGPMGGELRRFWQGRQPGSSDDAQAFSTALGSARCINLATPDGQGATWALASGSRLECQGLAEGLAVDRAMDILLAQGVSNAWVQVGAVHRALGGGPSGKGWPIELPSFSSTGEPLDNIWLQDQALVLASAKDRRYYDHRSGRPASGTLALVVVSPRASDASGLANTLFATGQRSGQRRLGTLSPRPSVLWVLGEDHHRAGRPLEASYRWSEIKQIR
jgi:thiamine biosynthesis lipoprotein